MIGCPRDRGPEAPRIYSSCTFHRDFKFYGQSFHAMAVCCPRTMPSHGSPDGPMLLADVWQTLLGVLKCASLALWRCRSVSLHDRA